MRILKAQCAGACYGVQRALDLAYKAQGAETLGPLIHNPAVVAELEARGTRMAAGLEDIVAPEVVIRSHGVTPQVLKTLEEQGRRVIDATCPHVKRAQNAAAKLAKAGSFVLVLGEPGHPEVESIVEWAALDAVHKDEICIVHPSLDKLPDFEVMRAQRERSGQEPGIVVQTTQDVTKLEALVEVLRGAGFEPIVKNTICLATSQRQKAAADLAAQVECMVVIGGKNSSNTTRLFEICDQLCPRAIHIESIDELDSAYFEGLEVVGITAGASTPESQIDELVAWLEGLKGED